MMILKCIQLENVIILSWFTVKVCHDVGDYKIMGPFVMHLFMAFKCDLSAP